MSLKVNLCYLGFPPKSVAAAEFNNKWSLLLATLYGDLPLTSIRVMNVLCNLYIGLQSGYTIILYLDEFKIYPLTPWRKGILLLGGCYLYNISNNGVHGSVSALVAILGLYSLCCLCRNPKTATNKQAWPAHSQPPHAMLEKLFSSHFLEIVQRWSQSLVGFCMWHWEYSVPLCWQLYSIFFFSVCSSCGVGTSCWSFSLIDIFRISMETV